MFVLLLMLSILLSILTNMLLILLSAGTQQQQHLNKHEFLQFDVKDKKTPEEKEKKLHIV